jgi:uncharacterized membrane protein YqjE
MLKETLLKFFKLDGLLDNLTGYIETRVELMKHEIKEDVAKVMAKLALILVAGSFIALFILFASVAIAMLLSETWGTTIGFAIVGGGYLLITVFIIIFRHTLSRLLEKQLKKILKNT